MGSTVSTLVTQIDRSVGLTLWEAAMVVVLLSRTRRASDIYFIWEANETITTLWETLLKGDQYLEYVTFLLESLTNTLHNDNEIMMDRPQFGMFHQKQTSLPLYGEHICYMLVSLKDTKASYIGYTTNLRKCINKHNSTAGGSTGSNCPHLKPWGLLAYVAGFNSKELALKFEWD